MQKLAEVCIRRPVFAAMIILAMVVVGATSYVRLGVDRLPSVDLPTVSIRTNYPGASPEDVEVQIAQRIEEAVNTVEGIYELRSISGAGTSVVIVTFNLNRDIDTAAQDVRDRVATILAKLPDDADPPIISKADNDASPVLTMAVSGPRSLRELTELADKVVKQQLERSSGVGQVSIVGGLSRTINIWLDADRLVAYQMPVTTVRDAIARQNTEIPGGNVTAFAREQTLRTMARLQSAEQFHDLVLTTINGVPVRLSDVGHAEDGAREQRSNARLNGEPSVTLELRRQSGANTVAVIEEAKKKLAEVQEQLPSDVKVEIIRDQSSYIYAALHEIRLHLVMGAILASLVVLLFMRNWRATLIAAIAIPASVISTFGVMWALNFTLNSVTMLALVLMVGVVIDDAIVVLENIFRFVEEKKLPPMEAARQATAEIALPVLATTLSLVVIFVPVSFMSSVSGRFLYQFGITAAVAVMVSLLVSFTLTPMMSARLVRVKDAGGHGAAASRRGFYAVLDRLYAWMLRLAMRHRLAVMVVAAAAIASAWPLYGLVKQEFVPSDVDEAEFSVSVSARESMAPAGMDEAMRLMSADVQNIPGVRLVLASSGGGFISGAASGNMYVRIAPHEQRVWSVPRLLRGLLRGDPGAAFRGNYSQRDVMMQVRRALARYTNFRCSPRNYPSFNIGGGNFDIDMVFKGPELAVLYHNADQLRRTAPSLGGILDPDITLKLDKPELRVHIDRERAADLGVDMRDAGAALRLMVGGDTEISRFRDESTNQDYDVQLRLLEKYRTSADALEQLYVPRRGGGMVALDNLARLESVNSASRIDRLDRQRSVSFRAQVGPGYAQADRIAALRGAIDQMNLPQGYSVTVSGRARELERTFTEFLWAFALSIVFMYMILASQFESTVHPLTILLSLPLSVPFALLSLHLAGSTLNLYSALGILVLFGVVKKNAILQIDHMNNLRRQGLPRYQAIIQANRDRLRPILMTTLSLVAGMLPLALGTGPGSEERHTIAVVVIGGQSLALILTLLVTPVAYSIFDDIGAWIGRRPRAGIPEAPVPVEQPALAVAGHGPAAVPEHGGTRPA